MRPGRGHHGDVTGRRAIFLDFDGTYADRGLVPEAHVGTVRAARAAGHAVFLCTGRPRAMLSAEVLRAGFDGLVAAAGGYVEVAEQVVLDRRFPAELARRALAVLDEHDVAYLLEAPEAVYGPPGVAERLRALLVDHFSDPAEGEGTSSGRDGTADILAQLRPSSELGEASFGKVTIFDSPVSVTTLAAAIGDGVGVIPSSIQGMGDSAGELYLRGVHKAVGMEVAVAHLGLGRAATVAFGDSLNDVEMLEYAAVGVAIDGGHPDVLAVADHVAQGPEREGLVAAFAELGLL